MTQEEIEEGKRLLAEATPGPWQEDGTLILPDKEECDASANNGKDWITFKSRRPDTDRALFIYAVNNLPALLQTQEQERELRERLLAAGITEVARAALFAPPSAGESG